jgi:hypothetical protein
MKRITLLTLVPAALLAVPAVAQAAVPGPSASDVTAARQAATSSLGTLGKFFAARNGTVRSATSADVSRMAPRISGATVPVYDLNPAFVAGRSGDVAGLVFMATPATASDGRTASVWTARSGTRWKVVNIASGTDEETFGGSGGLVFREPQINAWYAIRSGKVTPLNAEARQSLPAGPVTLAAYQKLVKQRYGDKLPGSAYAHKGLAGGYGGPFGSAGPVRAGGGGGTGEELPMTVALLGIGALGAVYGGIRLRRAHR